MNSVGGNREKTHFEYTFGMPEEELHHIAPPSRANRRILAELEYALHVSDANEGAYAAELTAALDGLLESLKQDGVLTDAACLKAEEQLAPMAELAKSYKLFLTGHAHIDMNWMWSYQETVAATLATFRTMCNIMDEYPEFTFTQSQGSVYRIVEKYDPELMARMKKYIAEGRWEVAPLPARYLGREGFRHRLCAGYLRPCRNHTRDRRVRRREVHVPLPRQRA